MENPVFITNPAQVEGLSQSKEVILELGAGPSPLTAFVQIRDDQQVICVDPVGKQLIEKYPGFPFPENCLYYIGSSVDLDYGQLKTEAVICAFPFLTSEISEWLYPALSQVFSYNPEAYMLIVTEIISSTPSPVGIIDEVVFTTKPNEFIKELRHVLPANIEHQVFNPAGFHNRFGQTKTSTAILKYASPNYLALEANRHRRNEFFPLVNEV